MKILSVLYPGGKLAKKYPNLLGCAENGLGLKDYFKSKGSSYNYVSISNRDEELCNNLIDTDILITTPFWPVYVTKERMDMAKKLKLILTAGVGSDHIDLKAAKDRNITVAEITGSNVVSVAEHAVMQILILVRNFLPAYNQVIEKRWDIAEVASRAHDLENKVVGILGSGRIGQRVMSRLKAFDVKLIYNDFKRLTTAEEIFYGTNFVTFNDLLKMSDIITIHCPLTPKTEKLFNKNTLYTMKKGAYLINTARGKIVETKALVDALESEHLAGYAGDVWYPQPAPADHPWRNMPNHGMTIHISGTTLEAQERYANGTKECLECFFNGDPIDRDYLIVENGRIVSPSYSYAFD